MVLTRTGSCNHCGDCCAGCPHIRYSAVRALRKGDPLVPVTDFVTSCAVYGQQPYLDKWCDKFPPAPQSAPFRCGYKWVEVP